MTTRNKLITFEETGTRIGVLPTLFPRPNSKNIRILYKALIEVLQSIPSFQSLHFGYMGFVTTPKEYALTGEPPWVDYADPGVHWPLEGNAPQQRDLHVTFAVASNIFKSKKTFDKQCAYTPTDNPRAILVSLQRRYRKRTPAETEKATLQWGAPWTSTDPIKSMFLKLKELYIQAVIAEVPYMQAQLLDQALGKIKKMGLFIQTIVTWNALPPNEKNGANFKAHLLRPTTLISKVSPR